MRGATFLTDATFKAPISQDMTISYYVYSATESVLILPFFNIVLFYKVLYRFTQIRSRKTLYCYESLLSASGEVFLTFQDYCRAKGHVSQSGSAHDQRVLPCSGEPSCSLLSTLPP